MTTKTVPAVATHSPGAAMLPPSTAMLPPSTTTNTITLYATVVGDQAFAVNVDRDASIATLFDATKAKLLRMRMPHDFTAYTSQRGSTWLIAKSPDYHGIRDRNATIVAKYITPTARLDESQRVTDYFGDAPGGHTVHMVLKWTPAAQREQDAKNERLRVKIRQAERNAEAMRDAMAWRQALARPTTTTTHVEPQAEPCPSSLSPTNVRAARSRWWRPFSTFFPTGSSEATNAKTSPTRKSVKLD